MACGWKVPLPYRVRASVLPLRLLAASEASAECQDAGPVPGPASVRAGGEEVRRGPGGLSPMAAVRSENGSAG